MSRTQKKQLKTATISTIAAVAIVALLIGPTAVLAQADGPGRPLQYRSRLSSVERPAKLASEARELRNLRRAAPRKATPVPEVRVAASSGHTLTQASASSSGGSTTSSGGTTTSSGGTSTSGGGTSELAQAQSILAGYIGRYPILAGTTVSIGTTPGGHQAVAYYTVGKIVISPTHTSSLQTILAHEIWHVIDYRDNGQIDWGENVPPANY